MARPLRIEYPGALYHVTSRGNAREPIFLSDIDRELFLFLLDEVVRRFNWLCHAYCLMDNHYHLLIETPDPTLSSGMRHLNGVYTQRFNRQHQRVGHLLQGRFKAILVDKLSYLLELARYIVLNPVRAGMVETVGQYPWSSYRATVGYEPAPPWLCIDWLLSQFAHSKSQAQQHYLAYVHEGSEAISPWSALKGQIILGDEAFIRQIQPLLDGATLLHEVPRNQRMVHRPSLESLFTDDLQHDKHARDTVIHRAYTQYSYTMSDIARCAGIHYTTVSKIIKGVR